jgi:hypothetical protein
MAARLNPQHDAKTREKIQTSQLINRLQDHANGAVDMTPTQVRAAEVLLKKSLPDLTAVQVSGDEANPLVLKHIEVTIVDPRRNPEDQGS